MCVRTKTRYGCGCEYRNTIECHSSQCTGVERYLYPRDGKCRECKGAAISLNRTSGGKYRFSTEDVYEYSSRRYGWYGTAGTSTNRLDILDEITPWASPLAGEKEWTSASRRRADDDWLREHEERILDLQLREPYDNNDPSKHEADIPQPEDESFLFEHDSIEYERRTSPQSTIPVPRDIAAEAPGLDPPEEVAPVRPQTLRHWPSATDSDQAALVSASQTEPADTSQEHRDALKAHTDKAIALKSQETVRSLPDKAGVMRAIWRPEVLGSLNGASVSALADTGSCVDAISLEFATQQNISVDRTQARLIRLPTGTISTEGIALGEFKFEGEEEGYKRRFEVLKTSFYDVILGKPFLDQTESLTRNLTKRIHQALVPCLQRADRLFLLDHLNQSEISCTVNGKLAGALPDTGSDLMFVSGNFTRSNNLEVHRGLEHRRWVSFIDGSEVLTDGIVLAAELHVDIPNLPFGAELSLPDYVDSMACVSLPAGAQQCSKYLYDLHVLEHLPCDIILSNQFIHDHEIFPRLVQVAKIRQTRLSGCVVTDSKCDPVLCVIREVKLPFHQRLARKCRRDQPQEFSHGAVTWQLVKQEEEDQRDREDECIKALPECQQAAAREQERQRRHQWAQDHPPPQTPAVPSSATGTSASAIATQSQPRPGVQAILSFTSPPESQATKLTGLSACMVPTSASIVSTNMSQQLTPPDLSPPKWRSPAPSLRPHFFQIKRKRNTKGNKRCSTFKQS